MSDETLYQIGRNFKKVKNYEPILNRINGTRFILKDLYVYTDSWNVKVFGVKLKKSIDFQISFLIKKKKTTLV